MTLPNRMTATAAALGRRARRAGRAGHTGRAGHARPARLAHRTRRARRTCRTCRDLAAAALTFALALLPDAAAARIKVVASINDLASIAATVGGDRVEVSAIARPNADVHRVEVLPSYMVRVARADLYLKVGMQLDRWADQVIAGSRNGRLQIVDCSEHVVVLDRPTTKVDARQGDVHPEGNPHYWLDPGNAAAVAAHVAQALARIEPGRAAEFQARAETFALACEARRAAARERLAGLPSRLLLTYHASWLYFAHATGLEIVGTVEPVPGIPPTGRHLQQLVNLVRERRVPVLLQEPYFSGDAAEFLARETGIRVARVSASCDAAAADSYLTHFDRLVGEIAGPARP